VGKWAQTAPSRRTSHAQEVATLFKGSPRKENSRAEKGRSSKAAEEGSQNPRSENGERRVRDFLGEYKSM